MTHWTHKLIDILQAETTDLRELAFIAGENPNSFYVGTNVDGVDVRGQDLRGMRFTFNDASTIIFDNETKFDENMNELFRDKNLEKVIFEIIINIGAFANKEERICKIISLYINYKNHQNIIRSYRDKSASVNRAIEIFHKSALNLINDKNNYVEEGLIKFTAEAISSTIKMNRALLLVHMDEYFKTYMPNHDVYNLFMPDIGLKKVLNLINSDKIDPKIKIQSSTFVKKYFDYLETKR